MEDPARQLTPLPQLAEGPTSVTDASCRAPQPPGDLVARDQLVLGLVEAPRDRTVVVTAPAGYGKTTTALLWDQADERPFAWANLSDLDDDPVHLVRHLALALDAIDPTTPLDESTVRALGRPTRIAELDMLPALVEAMAGKAPFVLVIDDVHVLGSAQARRCLDALMAAKPPECQLVLVGRSMPSTRLARRRMSDEVLDLTPTDLAMSSNEAAPLFDDIGLDVDALDALVDRTEGWPGALHLAALALAQSDRHDLQAFEGPHSLLADYLVEEVLAGEKPELVDFLEQSSVLDTLDPLVLDPLLDIDDSRLRLEGIAEAGNLFVVPLDRAHGRYRFHHLFTAELRRHLWRDRSGLARSLNDRASRLLEDRGDIDGAIRHAVNAGDHARAADLVLRQALPLVSTGRIALLGRWLDVIGPDAADRYPAAAIASALYAMVTGDVDRMKAATTAAEQAQLSGPLADGSPSVAVVVAALRAFTGWDGVEGVVRDTQIVRDAGPTANPWWTTATLLQGTAYSMLGRFDEARERFTAGLEAAGAPAQRVAARAQLALLALYEDDLVEADRSVTLAVELMEQHDLQALVLNTAAYPVAALTWARSGRGDDARRASAIGREMAARLDYLSPRSALLDAILLARTALALGDRPQARELAEEACRARRREPTATHLNAQLDELLAQLEDGGDDAPGDMVPITAAELRVLTYLPTHLSLREIAEALFISRHTAKTHSVAIYRKLGVSSRGEAVNEARRLGVLST